jgi:hypothetical protein
MRSPRRRSSASLICAAVAASVLTGCGPATVAPASWAAQVCGSLAPWRTKISSLNANAQSEMSTARTPEETRVHLLELLDGGRKATKQARDEVSAAGVPDVDGGAVIERRFVASLDAATAAYQHAYTSISGLSTDDPNAFYTGVANAMTTLNTEYSQSGVNTDALVSPELQTDFDKVSACR